MKKLLCISFLTLLLSQCGEEKPLIEQAVEQRCACLEMYDKEKDNIMEVLNCSDEVSKNEKFSNLDPQEIMEGMEKSCPNAALPTNGMIQ